MLGRFGNAVRWLAVGVASVLGGVLVLGLAIELVIMASVIRGPFWCIFETYRATTSR